jgi:flagellar motility protein MotE (MotC chaperone)
MEEIIIWDMCPYCEQEVELTSIRLQPCPRCGAHFQPGSDAIEEAMQNMKDELMELANLAYSMREAQKEFYKLRYSQHHDKRAEVGERMAELQKTMDAELREILELED